ncbi:MAG: hypothetical protein RJQ10_11230 [Haliea sp.]|uniref:hypothetical protein n=1 Tax=Haliea sp. TaxID=1932666 RepID=UPI0032EC06C1
MLYPTLALLLSGHALFAHAQGKELYRYINSDGVVVVDYQVPPEYVAGGYEVLNLRGVVLRVVPRTPTAEELADGSFISAEEEARLRRYDKALLLRYSTVPDIEAARDRSLGDLRMRLNILESNRRGYSQQIQKYQAQAADLERRGTEVDPQLLKTIAELQRKVVSTERQIAERRGDLEEAEASFAADIEHFLLLQENVQLRGGPPVVENAEDTDTGTDTGEEN